MRATARGLQRARRPLGGGPADLVLVAEEPGRRPRAPGFAGIAGPDPGPLLVRAIGGRDGEHGAHAKVKAAGHPTPLWAVEVAGGPQRVRRRGRGMWLYAIAWPASAGYLLAEDVVLHDLCDWLPPELVYGAPSPYLHGQA